MSALFLYTAAENPKPTIVGGTNKHHEQIYNNICTDLNGYRYHLLQTNTLSLLVSQTVYSFAFISTIVVSPAK